MKRGQRVPDDVANSAIELCDSGLSVVQIARRLNISETATRVILRKAGAKPSAARRGPLSQKDKDEIIRLFDSGVSPGAIAIQLSLGRGSVVYQLKKADRGFEIHSPAHVVEELDFLLGTDSFESLCQRLNVDPDYAIEKLLPGAGRPDLVARAIASSYRRIA